MLARPRLLILDEEPRLTRALARLLHARFEVASISSAREALTSIDRGADFDVLLVDTALREIPALEFLESLGPLAERVVMMTAGPIDWVLGKRTRATPYGRSDDPRPRALARRPVVDKPFTIEEVLPVLLRVARSARGSTPPDARGSSALTVR
jgi:CheY-like chemotaxis protein